MIRHVVVVGAGPVGLEAAVRSIDAGHRVTVVERDRVAANVRRWGHVRFFSEWGMNTSDLGRRIVDRMGAVTWDPTSYPTGFEYADDYLAPLGAYVREHGELLEGSRVLSIGRQGQLKTQNVGNDARSMPGFVLLLVDAAGQERYLTADVVLDCSGTFGNPNYLGPGGLPALGERALNDRICWVVPDVLGDDRTTYADRTTLVVGAGYSAITTLSLLLELANQAHKTRVIWVTRAGDSPYESIAGDPLPERARLIQLGNQIAASDEMVDYHGSAWVRSIHRTADDTIRVILHVDGASDVDVEVDNVVANVGYRPDTAMYRELQVHQCYATEGPMKLAAKLMSEGGGTVDCLAQTSGGADVLINPEPNFFILGSKSYGRNSSFLLKIGLEQIDAVLERLTGAGSH